MDPKYLVDKNSTLITFSIFESSQSILITVIDKSENQELLFQKELFYNSIKKLDQVLYDSWQIFHKTIENLAQNKPQNITVSPEGVLTIRYGINILGRMIQKQVIFALQRKLRYEDQVRILRLKVNSYEEQMTQLMQTVDKLTIQNQSMNARISALEQGRREKEVHKVVQVTEESTKKQPQVKHPKQSPSVSILSAKQEQIDLKLDVDPNCLHYSKFNIQDNTIKSLEEDYFQLNWKDPLPKQGIVRVRIKTKAQNHCSIGIITESQLKNQYSFQNKNSICLYTYFYGYFRGMYVRSQYHVLQWPIDIDEIIEIVLNLGEGTMLVGLSNKEEAKQIDIRQLQKQNIYFFVEMYEKNNCLEFL